MRRTMVAALAVVLMGMPAASSAENFTNTHFLTLEKQQRDYWLEGAVLMARHISHFQDSAKSHCIWDWYSSDPSSAQATIFASMQQYPDASPTNTVIALMRHRCGVPVLE